MAKSEAPPGTDDVADSPSAANVDTDEGEDNNADAVSEAGSTEVVSSSPNVKKFLAGNLNEQASQEVNGEKDRKRRGRRVRNQTLVVARKRSELGF